MFTTVPRVPTSCRPSQPRVASPTVPRHGAVPAGPCLSLIWEAQNSTSKLLPLHVVGRLCAVGRRGTSAPILTPFVATSAPILTPLVATSAPILAPFHPTVCASASDATSIAVGAANPKTIPSPRSRKTPRREISDLFGSFIATSCRRTVYRPVRVCLQCMIFGLLDCSLLSIRSAGLDVGICPGIRIRA